MTVLTTKVSVPPPRPDWVARERLVSRLDTALQHKLTVICAPAGFGKTTLITAWLHGLSAGAPGAARVAWLSLEEGDNTPLRFVSYLTAALKSLGGVIGRSARALLEAPRPPAVEHLITLLVNDVAEANQPGILVLDDFHLISDRRVQTAVTFLLDHLPPQLHLVIATREEPDLPLARLRAHGQLTEICLDELRFTRDEAAAFLHHTMGLTLSADVVDTLERRTEGWVVGLQMAALSLRGHARKPGPRQPAAIVDKFGGAHRDVIDYLGTEVLQQQPTDVRVFLRQTSILDVLSAPLCDAVTGQTRSHELLAHLAHANLFLIPLDDQRRWYRYHALFGEFLRTELAEWEKPALHQRAARWYEEHGFSAEAIKHALAGPDVAAAERLIRKNEEAMFSGGQFRTLLEWLNALPDDIVRARSGLAVDKAWVLYLGSKLVEAEAYVQAAIEAACPGDSALDRGKLLAFRACLAIDRGEYPEAITLGRQALALLEATRTFFRTAALTYLGWAQGLVGDTQAGTDTLRRAITEGQQHGQHPIALEAVFYLTRLLDLQGQLREAILLSQEAADRYTDDRGHPRPMCGIVLIALGTLHFQTNDVVRAESCLTAGISLCRQLGAVYHTLLGLLIRARLQFARGQAEAAWDTLASARRVAAQAGPRRVRLVAATLAELQIRQGQVAAAARTLAVPLPVPSPSDVDTLTVARLLLVQGRAADAQRTLRGLEQAQQSQGRIGSPLVNVKVLQALVEQSLNRRSNALERIGEALSLAAHAGNRRPFLDEGPAIADLLAERRRVAPEFVDELLRAIGESASDTPSLERDAAAANAALLEPLSHTQMTILRLVADGLSNQDIADKLEITLGTVKWHLNQIYGKLGVTSRTQAIAYATKANLLSPAVPSHDPKSSSPPAATRA